MNIYDSNKLGTEQLKIKQLSLQNAASINYLTKNREREAVTEKESLEQLAFLPFTKKIFRQPIPVICDFTQHFFANAPIKKKF